MPELMIFIDDGGVMNDNRLRGPQWQRLVGEFLAPRLGGVPEAWARANREFTSAFFAPDVTDQRLGAARSWFEFDAAYQIDWLRGMCEIVGVANPGDDQCVEIGRAASHYVIPRVRAAYPGAAEAILSLHAAGYEIYTASGEPSGDLSGYLSGMGDGVREAFTRLYGPDLIDTMKLGPEYYRRVFADCGVDPRSALVVDDQSRVINWALEAGASAILVGDAPAPADWSRIGALADLPVWLQRRS